MKQHFFMRAVSFLTAFTFVLTNHFGFATAHAEPVRTESVQIQPMEIERMRLPVKFGEIVESHAGNGNVIVIQDAHAIPDAQKNIANVIKYLRSEYGIGTVNLEGASGDLDPQIFKSFPDQKLLKDVMKGYLDAGEIAGGTAAAVFDKKPQDYKGVEDWGLYEEALGFYLKAMESEPELLEKLNAARKTLNAEKEKVYSKEMLAVDSAVEKFYENASQLTDLVKVLGDVKAPAVGSELEAVWKEIKKASDQKLKTDDQDAEVRGIAKQVEAILAKKDKEIQKVFNSKKQEWMTGSVTAEAFAMYLKETAEKYDIQIEMSTDLLGMVREQRKLKELEGTKFFRDLEQYIRETKEQLIFAAALQQPSVIANEATQSATVDSAKAGIRDLDARTEELRVLTKLVKLELSRAEWNQLKKENFFQRATSEEPRSTGSERGAWSVVRGSDLLYHMAFYASAEERDEVFFKNLSVLKGSSIIVAGGFHAEGITNRLKEAGMGYALVMPKIGRIPENNSYRAQMRGEVSWKDYFEVENGRIHLYKAFVRATRDRLLKTGANTDMSMLKAWRDQIIRDLSDQGKVERAAWYTRYMDEVIDETLKHTDTDKLMSKVDSFISGLRGLERNNQIDKEHIAQLLKANMVPPGYSGVQTLSSSGSLLTPSELRRLAAVAVKRSSPIVGFGEAGKPIDLNSPQFISFIEGKIPAGTEITADLLLAILKKVGAELQVDFDSRNVNAFQGLSIKVGKQTVVLKKSNQFEPSVNGMNNNDGKRAAVLSAFKSQLAVLANRLTADIQARKDAEAAAVKADADLRAAGVQRSQESLLEQIRYTVNSTRAYEFSSSQLTAEQLQWALNLLDEQGATVSATQVGATTYYQVNPMKPRKIVIADQPDAQAVPLIFRGESAGTPTQPAAVSMKARNIKLSLDNQNLVKRILNAIGDRDVTADDVRAVLGEIAAKQSGIVVQNAQGERISIIRGSKDNVKGLKNFREFATQINQQRAADRKVAADIKQAREAAEKARTNDLVNRVKSIIASLEKLQVGDSAIVSAVSLKAAIEAKDVTQDAAGNLVYGNTTFSQTQAGSTLVTVTKLAPALTIVAKDETEPVVTSTSEGAPAEVVTSSEESGSPFLYRLRTSPFRLVKAAAAAVFVLFPGLANAAMFNPQGGLTDAGVRQIAIGGLEIGGILLLFVGVIFWIFGLNRGSKNKTDSTMETIQKIVIDYRGGDLTKIISDKGFSPTPADQLVAGGIFLKHGNPGTLLILVLNEVVNGRGTFSQVSLPEAGLGTGSLTASSFKTQPDVIINMADLRNDKFAFNPTARSEARTSLKEATTQLRALIASLPDEVRTTTELKGKGTETFPALTHKFTELKKQVAAEEFGDKASLISRLSNLSFDLQFIKIEAQEQSDKDQLRNVISALDRLWLALSLEDMDLSVPALKLPTLKLDLPTVQLKAPDFDADKLALLSGLVGHEILGQGGVLRALDEALAPQKLESFSEAQLLTIAALLGVSAEDFKLYGFTGAERVALGEAALEVVAVDASITQRPIVREEDARIEDAIRAEIAKMMRGWKETEKEAVAKLKADEAARRQIIDKKALLLAQLQLFPNITFQFSPFAGDYESDVTRFENREKLAWGATALFGIVAAIAAVIFPLPLVIVYAVGLTVLAAFGAFMYVSGQRLALVNNIVEGGTDNDFNSNVDLRNLQRGDGAVFYPKQSGNSFRGIVIRSVNGGDTIHLMTHDGRKTVAISDISTIDYRPRSARSEARVENRGSNRSLLSRVFSPVTLRLFFVAAFVAFAASCATNAPAGLEGADTVRGPNWSKTVREALAMAGYRANNENDAYFKNLVNEASKYNDPFRAMGDIVVLMNKGEGKLAEGNGKLTAVKRSEARNPLLQSISQKIDSVVVSVRNFADKVVKGLERWGIPDAVSIFAGVFITAVMIPFAIFTLVGIVFSSSIGAWFAVTGAIVAVYFSVLAPFVYWPVGKYSGTGTASRSEARQYISTKIQAAGVVLRMLGKDSIEGNQVISWLKDLINLKIQDTDGVERLKAIQVLAKNGVRVTGLTEIVKSIFDSNGRVESDLLAAETLIELLGVGSADPYIRYVESILAGEFSIGEKFQAAEIVLKQGLAKRGEAFDFVSRVVAGGVEASLSQKLKAAITLVNSSDATVLNTEEAFQLGKRTFANARSTDDQKLLAALIMVRETEDPKNQGDAFRYLVSKLQVVTSMEDFPIAFNAVRAADYFSQTGREMINLSMEAAKQVGLSMFDIKRSEAREKFGSAKNAEALEALIKANSGNLVADVTPVYKGTTKDEVSRIEVKLYGDEQGARAAFDNILAGVLGLHAVDISVPNWEAYSADSSGRYFAFEIKTPISYENSMTVYDYTEAKDYLAYLSKNGYFREVGEAPTATSRWNLIRAVNDVFPGFQSVWLNSSETDLSEEKFQNLPAAESLNNMKSVTRNDFDAKAIKLSLEKELPQALVGKVELIPQSPSDPTIARIDIELSVNDQGMAIQRVSANEHQYRIMAARIRQHVQEQWNVSLSPITITGDPVGIHLRFQIRPAGRSEARSLESAKAAAVEILKNLPRENVVTSNGAVNFDWLRKAEPFKSIQTVEELASNLEALKLLFEGVQKDLDAAAAKENAVLKDDIRPFAAMADSLGKLVLELKPELAAIDLSQFQMPQIDALALNRGEMQLQLALDAVTASEQIQLRLAGKIVGIEFANGEFLITLRDEVEMEGLPSTISSGESSYTLVYRAERDARSEARVLSADDIQNLASVLSTANVISEPQADGSIDYKIGVIFKDGSVDFTTSQSPAVPVETTVYRLTVKVSADGMAFQIVSENGGSLNNSTGRFETPVKPVARSEMRFGEFFSKKIDEFIDASNIQNQDKDRVKVMIKEALNLFGNFDASLRESQFYELIQGPILYAITESGDPVYWASTLLPLAVNSLANSNYIKSGLRDQFEKEFTTDMRLALMREFYKEELAKNLGAPVEMNESRDKAVQLLSFIRLSKVVSPIFQRALKGLMALDRKFQSDAAGLASVMQELISYKDQLNTYQLTSPDVPKSIAERIELVVRSEDRKKQQAQQPPVTAPRSETATTPSAAVVAEAKVVAGDVVTVMVGDKPIEVNVVANEIDGVLHAEFSVEDFSQLLVEAAVNKIGSMPENKGAVISRGMATAAVSAFIGRMAPVGDAKNNIGIAFSIKKGDRDVGFKEAISKLGQVISAQVGQIFLDKSMVAETQEVFQNAGLHFEVVSDFSHFNGSKAIQNTSVPTVTKDRTGSRADLNNEHVIEIGVNTESIANETFLEQVETTVQVLAALVIAQNTNENGTVDVARVQKQLSKMLLDNEGALVSELGQIVEIKQDTDTTGKPRIHVEVNRKGLMSQISTMFAAKTVVERAA